MGGVTEKTTVTSGAQSVVNLTADLLDVADTPLARQNLTLVRSYITLQLTGGGAEGVGTEMAYGLIMTDGDALAALSLPDPISDVDAPWLYWDRRQVFPPGGIQQHLELDIKAQRKFRGNDATLVMILDNDDIDEFQFIMGFRLLFKL